ncbi:MAG: intein-containing recombinase RecA [Phototrophicaceae bacterium]
MAKKRKPIEAINIPENLEGRIKALDNTLKDITKRYGDGTIQRLGDAKNLDIDVVPSGSLGLDIAIGVGGVPRGRITEIYGPESSGKTTFCLHVIAEAQKRGGICAFVDMEHALDPRYAEVIGVDVETLYVSQPDTGEQALEITESLVRSGALDVIVVDSVAALVPRAEIEGEMGDSHVGLQARLMSQALRKLSGAVKQSNVTLIFTNQIREKVGVMFGCFDWQTTLMLADGSLRRISDIVHQQDPAEVMTYNQTTQTFEPKKVVNWFKNSVELDNFTLNDNEIGELHQEYQTLIATYPNNSGFTKFSCTPNHEILTPEGYVSAMYLDLDDKIITRYEHTNFSDDLHHLVMGSIMGDASIRKGGAHTASFREEHAEKQEDYLAWKAEAMGDLVTKFARNKRGNFELNATSSTTFAEYKEMFYGEKDTYKRITPQHVKMLNPFSLAVWYQDDGTRDYNNDSRRYSIAYHSVTELEARAMEEAFATHFGLNARVVRNGTFSRIIFSKDVAERFEQMVTPYIHPSMAYKTRLTDNVGECLESLEFATSKEWRSLESTIIEVRRRVRDGKKAVRYNVEVEDNANYIVGNTIVHNSPETTSGGRALKFYASVRLDIRRIQSIKIGTDNVGNRTRIKIKKNKVAPPFRETEFDIMFNEGISKTGEIIDIGTELEIIEKRGAFYRYNDELIGQGREKSKIFLLENPDISDEIEDKIRIHYGLEPMLVEDDE